jgi:hypothetical protein
VKILDSDILSLLFHDHSRVVERHRQENDEVATTIVSRIQVLQGRFAMLLKASPLKRQTLASSLNFPKKRISPRRRLSYALPNC